MDRNAISCLVLVALGLAGGGAVIFLRWLADALGFYLALRGWADERRDRR